jgi:hypothetical protein
MTSSRFETGVLTDAGGDCRGPSSTELEDVAMTDEQTDQSADSAANAAEDHMFAPTSGPLQ